ncbi:MAG: ABC transporter ATP-binding protein [Candidatus Auribacterota bacterium]|nr:ABC transporter ATP-binding protein [Candidatus Auribacterota bacterium]
MIEIIDIHKSFGELEVLKGVNLSVKRGETIVIIGRSGCGKSVLLKHLIGILTPDSGKLLFNDVDISQMKENELIEHRKKFGMLFQAAALFDSLSVKENVAFGLREHMDLSEEEIERITSEKLSLVGLYAVKGKKPAELSGGMRKRVGLARAFAMDPAIILYDEPTTGLDPITSDIINELIVKFKKELNVTSFAVTHDMKSAYKIADRIAMLYDGKIIESGTPEEIQNTSNPIVRQFIAGSSKGPIAEKNL